MTNHESEQETRLRQYLLGELELKDQVLVEQQLFLENQYAELAQAVEDDLVDDYVHDDLTESERENFKEHFLAQPEHNANVEIARALDEYFASRADARADHPAIVVDNNQSSSVVVPFPRRRVVWLSLAAALLIVLFLVTWTAWQSSRRQEKRFEAKDQQPAPTQSVNQPSPGPSLPGEKKEGVETVEQRDGGSRPNTNRGPSTNRAVQPDSNRSIIATIMPGVPTRNVGDVRTKVILSSGVKHVTLKLPVTTTETYDKYHVELRSNGQLVQSSELKSQPDKELGPVVLFTIPARLLTRERYEATMRGISADGRSSNVESYIFSVEKKP